MKKIIFKKVTIDFSREGIAKLIREASKEDIEKMINQMEYEEAKFKRSLPYEDELRKHEIN